MSRIFDEVQEGIVFINAGGDRLDYLNRAAAELFGGTVAGFENQPEFWTQGIAPQWRSQVGNALVQIWETETVEVHYSIVGIDGQHRDLSSKFWAIADDEGTPIRIEGTINQRRPPENLDSAIAQWFNLSLDLLCIAGTDGYFKQLNPMWETTLGYSMEELLSISFLELIHPDDVASTLAEVEKLSESKNSIYFENRYRCQDGSYKWMAWTSSTIQGDVIYAVARDISAHKQMEEERQHLLTSVQESEGRYRSVLSAMSEGVVMQDTNGIIYTYNQSARRILGLSLEQMMGWTALDPRWRAVREDGSPFLPEDYPLAVTLRTGEAFRDRIMGIHKPDGSLTWILVNTQTLFRPNETELYAAVCTFTDISDRIEAEALLRESEAKFRAAFEQAAVGIAHVGLDGNWLEVNQKFSDILGYSREELSNLTYQDITYVDDASLDVEAQAQLYDPAINTVTLEKRYLHKNGSLVWVNMTASMIRNTLGEPQYFLAVFEDIRERKQAQISLQQSQRLLEEAQQIAHVGNWEFDVATSKTIWSKELFRIYDFDPEQEAPPLPEVFKKLDPQDAEALKNRVETAITLGIPYELEHRIFHRSGSLRYVHAKGKVEHNSQGKVVRLFGTVLDITSRKKIEQELQEREQFLRAIWEGVDYSIFMVEVVEEREFRFGGINPKMAQTSQIPVEKMLGKTLGEVLSPEMLDLWHPRYLQCVQLRKTLSFEEYFVADDGIETWWLMTLSPLQDSENRIDRIIATTIDISVRKQAELALQHSEAQYRELAQREALLNRIATQIRNSLELDTILDSVVQELQQVMEIDRCHFAWYLNHEKESVWEVVTEARNPGLINLIGCYNVEQVGPMVNLLLTRETLKFDDIHGVSDPIFQEFLSNLGYRAMLAMPMETESGKIGVISCACHTGTRVWKPEDMELLAAVCDQLAIAINQAELYTQARLSAQIAEGKSHELQKTLQELQRTQSQLIQTEKMSSLGQLVAGVAHEINNPVNFIYGNLTHADDYMQDLLKLVELYRTHYPQPNEEIEEEIERIDLDYLVEDFPQILASMQLGANRIRDIVKSLRTFSRLDESDMKAVDLHENIDSTLMILQNRLKGKSDRPSIQVIKEYGPIPEITCYVGQINQVFMNVLGNAIDAVEMKGDDGVKNETDAPIQPMEQLPDPLIRITTTQVEGNRVQIAIADNGIGMKPEAISKIFDPFYTTKPIGKGTGLGLAISYEIIVEKHGGTMDCISEVGKGTEFIIEIPLEQNQNRGNPSGE
ncbi:PAS domain S-box protein [Laspinema sp. A4]|uniref:PAS domain S-box protein n=1 Tax=Laspinema sp. D2d TaxID=2953686 RepID=UPI0021BAF270|nr:PAS domain S-box protein [Laspinema sp. D2d]MCT7984383.1 PAS domain S-box protein [Laspinema sp. D2d]